jgi:hypothetical protein
MQTGKARPRPIVLIDSEHSTYWDLWQRFIRRELLKNNFILEDDFNLFFKAKNAVQAIRYIDDFYKVYHSIRYVSGLTVIRLNKKLSEDNLELLNAKFSSILNTGKIMHSDMLDQERKNNEYPGLPRLVMDFDRRHYGRLLEMIHIINKVCNK